MKRSDRILVAVIIAAGLTIAVLKAATAPITTDEAWNYNHWISGGLKTVLTDFSAFNNHILQTALSWLSIRIFGQSEFAQRYPSILGYLIFAFAFIKVIELCIKDRILRMLCFAAVMLHPYLIDFAALARGYMLSTALNTCAVYFMLEAMNPDKGQRRSVYLLAASWLLGLSDATILSAMRLLPAFLLILLLQPMTAERTRPRLRDLALLVFPALLVTAAFHLPSIKTARNLSIELGTKSAVESLRSLRMLCAYIPSAALDAGGNPLANPDAVTFWSGSASLQRLYQLLLGDTVLSIVPFAGLAIIVLPFVFKQNRSALCLHITWIAVLGIILMERYVSGSMLPVGRAWLALTPFPAISAFGLVEWLLSLKTQEQRKIIATAVSALVIIVILFRIDSFSANSYWEWPDNSAAPQIISEVADLVPPARPSSLSCPDYYHAPLKYYADRTGFKELQLRCPHDAPAAYHLLREDLLSKPVSELYVLTRYTNTCLVLMRDPSTPIGI